MMENVQESIDWQSREGLPVVVVASLSRRMPTNRRSWSVQRRLSRHFDARLGSVSGSFGLRTMQADSRRMQGVIGYLNPWS